MSSPQKSSELLGAVCKLCLCFIPISSTIKLAPKVQKTKGIDFSIPFCFVILRRGSDWLLRSRWDIGINHLPFHLLACDNIIQVVLLTLLHICLPLEQKIGIYLLVNHSIFVKQVMCSVRNSPTNCDDTLHFVNIYLKPHFSCTRFDFSLPSK